MSVTCSISKFSIHPFLNLAPGIASCTLPHNPRAAIVFFLGSFSLTILQNARNKLSPQDKDSECLENVSAAVLSGVVPALLISPTWGLKWEPSGQPSSRRGSDSVGCVCSCANGLRILNSTSQPLMGPCSPLPVD